MTAPRTPRGRAAAVPDDDARNELAHLLPAPPEQELPAGRYAHHKERLMRTIDEDHSAEQPAGAPRRTFRDRLPRPAVLVPVASAALAGALAGGLLLGSGSGDTAPGARGGKAGVELNRISEAAMASDSTPKVRDDQFVYLRSKGQDADETDGTVRTEPLRTTESWLDQSPGKLQKLAEHRVDGGRLSRTNAELGDEDGTAPGLGRPTYRWLASLPDDPDELLTHLRDKLAARPGQDDDQQGLDQEVFDTIGSLVGGVVPPRTAATLYRAAARIPGVEQAPEAKDAIGRQGVGIARTDKRSGARSEWVFDPDSLDYLGARTYLITDSRRGTKGTLLHTDAILTTAVVDHSGTTPTPDQIVTSTPPRTSGS